MLEDEAGGAFPPERRLYALLVQILLSVRSERQLMNDTHASTRIPRKVDWVFTFTAAAYSLVRPWGLATAPTSLMAGHSHTRTSSVSCDPAGCRVARI